MKYTKPAFWRQKKIVTHGPGVIHTSLEKQNRGAVQKKLGIRQK
jgi:hypothetical protein